MEDFYVNDTVAVRAPLMTHTGQYHYLDDEVNQAYRSFRQNPGFRVGLLTVFCCPEASSVHRGEAASEQALVHAAGASLPGFQPPGHRV